MVENQVKILTGLPNECAYLSVTWQASLFGRLMWPSAAKMADRMKLNHFDRSFFAQPP